MTRKQRRLSLIGAALGVLVVAVALVLGALRDSIVFFNSPSDLAEKQIKSGTRMRIGGLVKEGSVQPPRQICGVLRGHRRQEHRPRGLSAPAARSVP